MGGQGKRVEVALDLIRELGVQSTLDHPNVLPLLGFYLSKTLEEAWLVSPYATNGNLYDYLERVNPHTEVRLKLAKDTAKGLCYLHTRVPPICHGDIKILNILVAANQHAMLCDFGLSKSTEGATTVTTGNNGGTSRYWSPELFSPGNRPTLESDIWAWGCLLLEIVTGRAPYNDEPLECRVIHQITKNIPPAPVDALECPSHVRGLLAECWRTAPDARPSMQRALASLSAGNLHQLSSTTSSQGSLARAGIFEALERELTQVIEPLQNLRIEPSHLKFPKTQSTIGSAQGSQKIMVAVKKLRASGGRDKCLRMAIGLIRELAAWAKLSHENIIPLTGFWLSERLDQAWLISPCMADGNIVSYLLRVQATEKHRLDLLNVLITKQNRAVLCDLGLARTMEAMPSGLTTSTFNQAGSLPYSSPELILGTSKRTPWSDVWAWGCLLQEVYIVHTLHFMLQLLMSGFGQIFSGKTPYHRANNPGVIVKWIIGDIPPAAANDIACPDRGCDDRRAVVLERSKLIFNEEDRIGSGIFGALYRARLLGETGSETVVAVKELFVPSDNNSANQLHSEVVAKVNRWSTFPHTNILRITSYYPAIPSPSGEILLAFPFVSSGNLAAHLDRSLEYSQKISLADDITQGLLYLHTRTPPVHHGRLHPNNVFVTPRGHALIGDYDLAGITVDYPSTANAPLAELKRYQSPEQLTKTSEPGITSDIWAFGCVLLKIVTGRLPYQDTSDAELVDAVRRESLPAPIDDLDCPPRAQNVLGICWRWAPEARPGISEIATILSGRLCEFEKAWSIPVNGTARCLRFSHCGKYLVVGFTTHIRIYETENGRLYWYATCLSV
ncbi:hypothetical protein FRB99_008607 [Tulasnella sp. 403]|nr:hypothetical protein FRB99_008607 [Tulasnella sp. 403]